MKLFVCFSYYHVYVTLLKALKKKQNEVFDIIITDQVPNSEDLIRQFIKLDLFHSVLFIDDIARGKRHFHQISLFNKISFVFNYRKKLKSMFSDVNLSKYEEICIYFDRQHLAQYVLFNHNHVILSEDSRYSPAAFKFRKSNIRILLEKSGLISRTGGMEKNIYKIECSDIEMLPLKLQSKYARTPFYELEQSLTAEEKALLLKVFNCRINSINENSCLLLTQPLFADRLVSTAEKQYEIYKKVIINNCSSYKYVYIKPHPRDDLNYADMADNIIVLNRFVPFELYQYLDIRFSIYLTLFSTSLKGSGIHSVKEIGYDIDPELKKNYATYIKKKV